MLVVLGMVVKRRSNISGGLNLGGLEGLFGQECLSGSIMNKKQSFQLRLPSEIHQKASDRAWEQRMSLNQWIVDVIYDKLGLTDSLMDILPDLVRREDA